jgi:hypothetical protein
MDPDPERTKWSSRTETMMNIHALKSSPEGYRLLLEHANPSFLEI